MKKILPFLIFVLLACGALLLIKATRPVSVQRGMSDFFINIDNAKRHYRLHTPANATSNMPLVIVLHGGAGSGEEITIVSRMNETADLHGFVVAYPDGTGTSIAGKLFGTWNAGACCRPATEENVNDVQFIDHMIDDIANRISLDSRRVYVTGLSNGAQMAYRLACELSEKITAVAPISGIAPLDKIPDNCRPVRAVPILHLHGALDPCVPINGGMCGGCFAKITGQDPAEDQWACDSLDSYMTAWQQRYALSSPKNILLNELPCRESSNANTSIIECIDPTAGHTWPGGTYGRACENSSADSCRLITKVLGPLNQNISANELMWNFFQRYTLP